MLINYGFFEKGDEFFRQSFFSKKFFQDTDKLKIADLDFMGAGFSEEALSFKRDGADISVLKYKSALHKKYDLLLISRSINLFRTKKERLDVYSFIEQYLKKKGKVVFCWINKDNSTFKSYFLNLKRGLLSCIPFYKGPLFNEVIYNSRFVKKNLYSKNVVSELNKSGFKVLNVLSVDKTAFIVIAEKTVNIEDLTK